MDDAVVAVDGLTFSYGMGEVVGLLGPNGAGKSTTIKVLTGVLPPGGGTVRVAGHALPDEAVEAKRRIGYVPEAAALFESLTGQEFLELMGRLRPVRVAGPPRAGPAPEGRRGHGPGLTGAGVDRVQLGPGPGDGLGLDRRGRGAGGLDRRGRGGAGAGPFGMQWSPADLQTRVMTLMIGGVPVLAVAVGAQVVLFRSAAAVAAATLAVAAGAYLVTRSTLAGFAARMPASLRPDEPGSLFGAVRGDAAQLGR